MPHKTMSRLRSALGASLLAVALSGAANVAITTARAAEVTFVLRIVNNQVPPDMRLIRVKQGDVVKLQWRADRPSIVHLHGYDIEKRVAPGAITELTFTARATGRFPVHLHGSEAESAGHGHEDALVTIEVYPR
jgi:FtsP/CotA-like multicopper oxidase with cupredoxin domain